MLIFAYSGDEILSEFVLFAFFSFDVFGCKMWPSYWNSGFTRSWKVMELRLEMALGYGKVMDRNSVFLAQPCTKLTRSNRFKKENLAENGRKWYFFTSVTEKGGEKVNTFHFQVSV